jgi:hypothetical protein
LRKGNDEIYHDAPKVISKNDFLFFFFEKRSFVSLSLVVEKVQSTKSVAFPPEMMIVMVLAVHCS